MIYWIIFLRVNLKYYISDLWFIRVCVYMLIHILVPLTPRYYCKGILLWFPKTSQAEKWAGVLVISLTANMHATVGTWTQKSLRINWRNDWHGFFKEFLIQMRTFNNNMVGRNNHYLNIRVERALRKTPPNRWLSSYPLFRMKDVFFLKHFYKNLIR